MKVVGIVGSPRKGGNTEILTAYTLKAIREEGLETELISLAGLDIKPCNACRACDKEERCPIEDDLFPIYLKMKEADSIILASPVYYGSDTSLIKAFMERAGHISHSGREAFKGKVGGSLVVACRAGQNFTLSQLTFWFRYSVWWCPVRPIGT
jgi:multimeric flavodoxin WrbA